MVSNATFNNISVISWLYNTCLSNGHVWYNIWNVWFNVRCSNWMSWYVDIGYEFYSSPIWHVIKCFVLKQEVLFSQVLYSHDMFTCTAALFKNDQLARPLPNRLNCCRGVRFSRSSLAFKVKVVVWSNHLTTILWDKYIQYPIIQIYNNIKIESQQKRNVYPNFDPFMISCCECKENKCFFTCMS
jgi:hypothetical protein